MSRDMNLKSKLCVFDHLNVDLTHILYLVVKQGGLICWQIRSRSELSLTLFGLNVTTVLQHVKINGCCCCQTPVTDLLLTGEGILVFQLV